MPKEMNANRFFRDSHWLEIWKNHFCRSMGPNVGSVAMDSVHVLPPLKISNAERLKLDFAERDKCKLVLLRLSLAGNLEQPCPFMGPELGIVSLKNNVLKA